MGLSSGGPGSTSVPTRVLRSPVSGSEWRTHGFPTSIRRVPTISARRHHAVDASRSAHKLPVQKLKPRGRLLIIPMLLSSTLFVTAVKDTVWWNTPGGEVTEHRGQTAASCSLMLYDDSGSVIFEWDAPGRTFVTASDRDWQFPDEGKMPAAIQVGDVWLSNGGGSVVIEAVGHGTNVSFTVTQPIDDLLRSADHIGVKTIPADLSIKLNHAKIAVLLSRARDCRDLIKR